MHPKSLPSVARNLLLLTILFLLAACNTPPAPTPPPATEVPPTAEPTEVPPTAVPTEVPPTAVPTEVPPTPEPTPVVEAEDEPPSNLVVMWNEAMLAAVRRGAPRPTVIARSLYIVHAAMYDAWTVYDEVAAPTVLDIEKRPLAEHTNANKGEAVSQAAYHTLIYLFPAYEANTGAFSRLLTDLGYSVAYAGDTTTPSGIGFLAAETVLADRANDGANEGNNYAEIVSEMYPEMYAAANSADPTNVSAAGQANFDLNRWQPLRVPTGALVDEFGNPTYDNADETTFADQGFLSPHWGSVRPFALTAGDQFRPQAPPQAGSDEPYTDSLGNTMTNDEAYHMQLDEVVAYSANLTDEHKVIAEFWADGPRSETPPGHWNAIAHGISYRDQHTIDDDVKMYFALNGAVFDSSIAAWDAKRVYDFVRPASAIRHKYAGQMIEAWAGPDMGTQMIPGESWLPYQSLTFVTPPFAEYVSGHSTFSASAAEVLTMFCGDNTFYDGETVLYNEDFNNDGLPDLLGQHIVTIGGNLFENSPSEVVILRWETFQDAADEAGISRLYGGIHFQDGDRFAREMGRQIGVQAFELAESYWTGEVAEQ